MAHDADRPRFTLVRAWVGPMLGSLFASLAIVLTACGSDGPTAVPINTTTVRIDVAPSLLSTQGVAPDFGAVVESVDRYDVSLTREGYDERALSLSEAGSAEFARVGYGAWDVAVVAFAGDRVVARGGTELDVSAEQASTIVQPAFLSEGEGTLELTLIHPPDSDVDDVQATLAPLDEPADVTALTLTTGTSQVGWNGTRPAGRYLFIAELLDADDVALATVTESVDVFGNLTSRGTIEVEATDLNGPPSAPTDLVASQDDGTDDVTMTWTDVSHLETAYEVERSDDDGSTWTQLRGAQQGTPLPASSIQYTDEDLAEGTYRYRVRAVNGFGSSAWATAGPVTVVLLVANDDLLGATSWDAYPGIDLTVDASVLLSNDEVRYDGATASIVGVSGAENGSVQLDGDQIVFTPDSAGASASFDYTARIVVDGEGIEDTATVTIEQVKEIPPVVAENDGPYDVVEGGTVVLDIGADLMANDIPGVAPLAFDGLVSGTSTGVTVERDGDVLNVTSTGTAGAAAASFEYRVKDGFGTTGTATVTLNVTLAPIDAFVYADAAKFSAFKSSGYQPPTFEEVRDSWPRVSGANYYTAPPYSGNADAWTYETDDVDNDDSGDPRIVQPMNVSPPEGFVSPLDEELEYYTFEATLFSNDGDDDSIGLIIAFSRDGATNRYIVAHRTKGGNSPSSGWGLSLYEGTSQYVLEEVSVGGTSGGWSGSSSRVRIERTGDQIVLTASPWNSTTFDADSEITVDLAAGTVNGLDAGHDLSVFQGPRQYGYFTLSQPYSTYLDIELEGGLERDVAHLLTDGEDTDSDGSHDCWAGSEVWRYQDGDWTQSTGATLQSELGYPRTVHVVDEDGDATGISYEILKNQVCLR